jgi:AraC-like DNA-binding protein
MDQIMVALIDKMKDQKLYLNSELSLSLVATILGIRKEVLSKVLNQGLSKNFYRFVNEYRVEEFKRLAENEGANKFTHLGLAYEAGFNSKTTFYKAFKQITQLTPSEYLETL